MNKEQQILELLNQGKTYTYIQSVVNVSPSKIAAVKKKSFTTNNEKNNQNTTVNEPNNEKIAENTTDLSNKGTTGSCTTTAASPAIANKTIINHNTNPKKLKTMSNYYSDDDEETPEREYSEQYELERLKLENEHEEKMRQIAKDEFIQKNKDRELRIEEAKIEAQARKAEQLERELLFKFRKLAKTCLEGDGKDWEEDDAIELYNKALALSEKVEEHCFINKIDQDDLKILVILEKITDAFDEFTENMGRRDELTLDDELKELLEVAPEVDFDDYF